MKIKELYKNNDRTLLSFEVFPPKKDGSITTVYETLENLADLNPDYISVTYGAGGNVADKSTLEIAKFIKNKLQTETMAHLTCINSTRENVTQILDEFKEGGVDNILALRGDINPNFTPKTDFKYASELINFIKENDTSETFGISAACYPECHTEAENIVFDVKYLKAKVDAGADTLVSQLFFDNNAFYRFTELAEIAGIDVPICAGIMPVTGKSQIERMVSMCGASLPQKFVKMISKYEHNSEALIDAGIAYATDQIVDLISNGVRGIHLYTMNRPYVARKITESVKSLL